jgi:hypothetical protein
VQPDNSSQAGLVFPGVPYINSKSAAFAALALYGGIQACLFLMSKLRSTDENRREKPVISWQNHRARHRLKNSAEFRHKITRYYHFAFDDG